MTLFDILIIIGLILIVIIGYPIMLRIILWRVRKKKKGKKDEDDEWGKWR